MNKVINKKIIHSFCLHAITYSLSIGCIRADSQVFYNPDGSINVDTKAYPGKIV